MDPRKRQVTWELPSKMLTLTSPPMVMGILNVTPDSFSDGGQHFSAIAAIDAALRMEDAGAGMIDIGGESTRPYSEPVTLDEERRRVLPIIESLASRLTIPVSIDTSKAQVAKEAISAGAQVINDVTGLSGDPEMLHVAVQSKAGVCAMHMQGTPQTMQNQPIYQHVVDDIHRYLQERLDAAVGAGIQWQRICLDPGIGFGKTHEHNFELLRGAHRFLDFNRPILVGHSRKGFIGKCIGDATADRMAGTLAVSLAMALAGIHIVRVHDVAETVHAFKLFTACGAIPEPGK
jgi:dihydropteroate synthase